MKYRITDLGRQKVSALRIDENGEIEMSSGEAAGSRFLKYIEDAPPPPLPTSDAMESQPVSIAAPIETREMTAEGESEAEEEPESEPTAAPRRGRYRRSDMRSDT